MSNRFAKTTDLTGYLNNNQYYGYIYNKKTSTFSLGDFNTNGATVALTGGNLVFSSGVGTFLQSLDLNGGTMLEKWTQTMALTVGTVSSSSYGVGMGIRSTNVAGLFLYSLQAYIDLSTSGTAGYLRIFAYGSAVATSGSALAFTAGDVLIQTLTRYQDTITFTVHNQTQNSAPITITYQFPSTYMASYIMPNTGTFSLFSIGGTQTITAYSVYSNELKGNYVLCVGDSKTAGYYAGIFSQRWASLVGQYFLTSVSAGGGDKASDVALHVAEIIALAPKYVLLSIGSNDLRAGTTLATLETTYSGIVNSLTAAGITVIHLLPLIENTGLDQSGLKAWIIATYPGLYIDTKLETYPAASVLVADNIHPNNLGAQIIAKAVLASGQFLVALPGGGGSGSNIAGSGSTNYVPYFSSQNVLSASNMQYSGGNWSIGGSLTMAGYQLDQGATYFGGTWAHRMGSLLLQPISFNNPLIGDNCYYNGAAWTKPSAGYAEGVLFQSGEVQLFANSTSAAGNFTPTLPFKVSQYGSGTVALGGSITFTPGSFTGAQVIIPGTGSIQFPNYTAGIATFDASGNITSATSINVAGSLVGSNITATALNLGTSATSGSYAIQAGSSYLFTSVVGYSYLTSNLSYNGGNLKYASTAGGGLMAVLNGIIVFASITSGTAGTNATISGYGLKIDYSNGGSVGLGGLGNNNVNTWTGYSLYVTSTASNFVNPANFAAGAVFNGTQSVAAWANNTAASLTSPVFYSSGTTLTDNSTAASTTVAYTGSMVLQPNTFAATNTTITYTNGATLFIGGAAVAGTNVTITNKYAIYVAGGASYFGGAINNVTVTNAASAATLTLVGGSTLQTTGAFTLNLTTTAASTPTFPTGAGTLAYIAGTNTWSGVNTYSNGFVNSLTTGNFYLPSTTLKVSATATQWLFGGATTVFIAAGIGSNTSTTLTTGVSAATLVVGTTPLTTFTSGTHAWIVNCAVAPLGSITSGGATVTATANLYVGAVTASIGAANYSFYSAGPTVITSRIHRNVASAINATATATAAQVATGLITCTSAAAETITLPTATLLATQLGAVQGFEFEFIVDNSAGANIVTLVLGSGMTQLSIITGANTLTIAAGSVGFFRLYFSSNTAAFFTRLG